MVDDVGAYKDIENEIPDKYKVPPDIGRLNFLYNGKFWGCCFGWCSVILALSLLIKLIYLGTLDDETSWDIKIKGICLILLAGYAGWRAIMFYRMMKEELGVR